MIIILLIIPSFNRASQLDCFLRSLLRYWSKNDLHIRVLYKCSNHNYEKAYYEVFNKHPHIQPILEYDFCKQIQQLVKNSLPSVIGFATDDCIVYRRPDVQPNEVSDIVRYINMNCFSLRHGKNTNVQNYLTGETQQPIFFEKKIYKEIIAWKWKGQPRFQNYGYCFSWDCAWYNRDWLLKCFQECPKWENPRACEHQFNINDNIRNFSASLMSSCRQSSMFVNTINAVQDNNIPAGVHHNYSPEFLNDEFLNGRQIALSSFDNLELYSSHYEVPLQFESVIYGLDS